MFHIRICFHWQAVLRMFVTQNQIACMWRFLGGETVFKRLHTNNSVLIDSEAHSTILRRRLFRILYCEFWCTLKKTIWCQLSSSRAVRDQCIDYWTWHGAGWWRWSSTCPLPCIGHFPAHTWSWSRLSKTVQKASQHLIMCLIIHVMRNMESVSVIISIA